MLPTSTSSSHAPGPQVGELVELAVEELGFGGSGVARHDGLLCVVPRALPGERVRARVWRRSRHTARLRLERILAPSPRRVPAPCRHFASCGGCHLQHLAYGDQLAAKTEGLRARLRRALGDDAVARLHDPVPAPRPMGYRVRTRFLVRAGRLSFGGLAGAATPIDRCPLAAPGTEGVLAPLRRWLSQNDSAWLQAVRVHAGTPAAVVLETDGPPDAEALGHLLADWQGLSVHWQGPDGRTVHVAGPRRTALRCGPFELLLSPGAFTQANPEVAALLYARAVQELAPADDQEVLDLYCGSGGLALHLAQRACHVYAVDVDHRTLEDGKAGQHHNLLANVTFRAGRCERIARKLLLSGARFPLATLNPPRTGLARELPELLPRLGARRLAYLSCSPATLVRDLPLLQDQGYALLRLLPFDMFAQTYHLEALAVLESAG